MNFYLAERILAWSPVIFSWIFWFASLTIFSFRKRLNFKISLLFKYFSRFGIIFYFSYSLALTLVQYFIWSSNPATRVFLEKSISPENSGILYDILPGVFGSKLGYFIFYSLGRFWLKSLIIILVSIIWFLFLKFLKKRRERFFDDGEIELGFLLALVVGWPGFIIFIPGIFLSVVLISIFKIIFLKEKYATLGYPFILSALVTIVLGTSITQALNLFFLMI